MRVLFLHPNTPDYLSSGLFHGLRTLLGKDCVDLPRFDCMYKPYTEAMRDKIRGKGFTLYGLLEDIQELATERFFIWFKNIKDYDLYIIADIWNHYDVYNQLRKIVAPEKIIVIDPSDNTRLFPFNSNRALVGKEKHKLFTSFHKNTKYYKRELTTDAKGQTGFKTAMHSLIKKYLPKQVLPINFSIPAEKISMIAANEKTKMFTGNIVDEDISSRIADSHFIPLGKQEYKFETEEAYYNDIKQSRFGITTKRSGWDCMRHYEFAANGAVLCFKNLDQKNSMSAPHGLDKTNCIIYHDYEQLMASINALSDEQYKCLQEKSYEWVYNNSTIAIASKLLEENS